MPEDKYIDVEIVKLREKIYDRMEDMDRIQNSPENNIHNGYVIIEGYKIPFSEKTVQNKIRIILPTEFIKMADVYIEIKYPAFKKSTGKVIITNEQTTINFIFNFSEQFIEPDDLDVLRDQTFNLLQKTNPAIELLEKSTAKTAATDIAYFEIITPSLDKSMYNFMYFFIVDQKLTLASFNCAANERKHWQDIIRQIITSIRIIKGDEKDGPNHL